MQTFSPERAPSNPKELQSWLDRQMLGIQRAANQGSDALPLRVLNVAPSRPQDGWLYNADGTNWDPGSGAGIYRYDSATATFIAVSGSGGGSSTTDATTKVIIRDCLDETTAHTVGLVHTFRMPHSFTLTEVRGSLTTAATGATLFAFDVKESGASIFTTKPTFDAGEKTTTTAAVPPVISDYDLFDDAEVTISIDAVGNTIAGTGLKVYLIGSSNPSVSPIGDTGLVGWYRKGVGLVNVAGAVSSWMDQSGFGHDLVQATGANQPTLQADGSVIFDGANDRLQALFTLAQPATIYLRVSQLGFGTGNIFADGAVGTNKMLIMQSGPPTNRIQLFTDDVGSACGNTDLAGATKQTVVAVFNGASSLLAVDSHTPSTGNPGVRSAGGFTLGSRSDGVNPSNIQVWEALVYNVAHDATQRAAVIAYLATV